MDKIRELKTTSRWIDWAKTLTIFAILYCFLVSIGMIGSAFKGLGGGFAKELIQSEAGPLIGLFIGILVTSLVQSSSTTTSLVVGMVAAGTFGQDPKIAVAAAIPYIMGANIGTSITNTIVALGHIVNKNEFRRAFAASIIHDFFNVIAVIILFPLQLKFGFISKSANWLAEMVVGSGTLTFKSPVKMVTKPTVSAIEDFFKLQNIMDYNWLLLIVAFGILFFSLKYLTKLIRSLIMERLEAFFDTHIFKTAARAMFFGVFITIMVQSSSITTSLIIPLAGAGVLHLRQIFPYTLGANIGTTVTALLASLVSGTLAPLAVAFGHLVFNIYGILIIWPVKKIRDIPLRLSQWFAELAIQNRIIPIIYILVVFFIIPLGLIFLVR
ncbi:MAG: Na/Pi symporter [Candidatus Marinimicrobia bacterium]|jgi:sodium-dependent phosphate cotransporter|nr:Na/Pi symporter [Candidatus Neomarinimicrobiota bacterium]MBT3618746.1 Na/Pi symporter [Candidatus Neomarinimicrobiota bacterium]MBT3828313.1 Na/Pi symporter [Candidatus Neomarinimicrobiota bacterium]MBT3997226.1 Na/Pi symporter [Candidatus Neomarinimicrobiota bacterium]MBT4280176.1 Na/Pi symporter [Candidatus Neomarinimicrobiota bacterium]